MPSTSTSRTEACGIISIAWPSLSISSFFFAWMRYCKMAMITEASVKIAPMMLRTMVIESVLSGEAELVGATGFTLAAGVAVPEPWVVERGMMSSSRSRDDGRKNYDMCREEIMIRMQLRRNKLDRISVRPRCVLIFIFSACMLLRDALAQLEACRSARMQIRLASKCKSVRK